MKSAFEASFVGLLWLALAVGCGDAPPSAGPATHASGPRCVTCHAADYASVDDPPHAGVKPLECGVCHKTSGWHPSELHHTWTLTGAHQKAECAYCHGKFPGRFQGTPDTCVGCHREDYDRSKYPGHENFPLTCADCHDTSAFKPATYVPPREEVKPRAHPADKHEAHSPAPAPEASPQVVHKRKPHPAPSSSSANQGTTAETSTEPVTPPAPPVSKPAPAPKPWPRPDTTTSASRRR